MKDHEVIDIRSKDDERRICPQCGLSRTLTVEGWARLTREGTVPVKCRDCDVVLVVA